MADVHGVILQIVAYLELVLGLYILLRNPKDKIRRWYSFFVFTIALWVWSMGFVIFIDNVSLIEIFTRLNWIAPILAAPTLLFFSWVFPYSSKKIGINNWLIFLFPILVGLFLIYSDVLPIFTSVNLDPWRTVDFGIGVHVFNTMFLIYWIWAINNLYKKYKVSDGINRWLLKNVLLGVLISSTLGIISNMLTPWVGLYIDYPIFSAIGPELSIIWLGFTSYILFKKNI